ncbi:Organic hydroperoxide reductase OsmC/OhrA [Filimonas lacunae]|uniref:Organic hydroperoxide reductase OsmC/OhrA n=1 Tax=Filimonas lacunae TaxID=477680 RepID=A0A173MAM1_9BACT|nr:OsmC family protein [Filimonas lacunae]BAV04603.1 OsmC/Ohr family protein [Filimonas lacunae]SIT32686.1 Organic hydroperoxide reductase OsmC/OhrA [Filimonas lacunae]
MSNKQHTYALTVTWTGNKGLGTGGYTVYNRDHIIQAGDKITIPGSSDPAFRGDISRYNPEELLVASLSSCHMLWYLHLCAEAGVVVTAYEDKATGIMEETANGGGHFTEVTLHPVITVAEAAMIPLADSLHQKANELCFIANSCKFPVHHQAQYHTYEVK